MGFADVELASSVRIAHAADAARRIVNAREANMTAIGLIV
jgi:hypothetical protein